MFLINLIVGTYLINVQRKFRKKFNCGWTSVRQQLLVIYLWTECCDSTYIFCIKLKCTQTDVGTI